LGVLYWEPEGAKSWSGYSLSAWGSDGRPTIAMNAFSDFISAVPGLTEDKLIMQQDQQNHTIFFNEELAKIEIINMNGMIIRSISSSNSISTNQLHKGVYLIKVTSRTQINSKVFKFIAISD